MAYMAYSRKLKSSSKIKRKIEATTRELSEEGWDRAKKKQQHQKNERREKKLDKVMEKKTHSK